ncbi:hypothetical protein LMG26411_05907 [Cupriavidus numazuensis]|uniref:Uncharacterized protein n=1 Tax=Cupriavidus numazuensis TaxID=221992 RepID=A0ABM8TQL0_9BURK|nr:hypothetical protein LMG26411_05907 [Cupriavidus numazuensis]
MRLFGIACLMAPSSWSESAAVYVDDFWQAAKPC